MKPEGYHNRGLDVSFKCKKIDIKEKKHLRTVSMWHHAAIHIFFSLLVLEPWKLDNGYNS